MEVCYRKIAANRMTPPTATVEQEMKKDWLFAPHYRYYVREMRIQAYSQLLESYRSLTLGYMAEAFGVSNEFIDQWVPPQRVPILLVLIQCVC